MRRLSLSHNPRKHQRYPAGQTCWLPTALLRRVGPGDEAVIGYGGQYAADYGSDFVDPGGAVNCPATIIGPRVRAGFREPPETGPAMKTPQASAKPTAKGATPVVPGRR